MVALKIEEQKAFTAGLFIGEIFDKFLVREAEIVTYNQFTIDGKVRQGYFSEEELEENRIEEYSSWKTLKPVCYSLIKGKRLPESFRIHRSKTGTGLLPRRIPSSWRGGPGSGSPLCCSRSGTSHTGSFRRWRAPRTGVPDSASGLG